MSGRNSSQGEVRLVGWSLGQNELGKTVRKRAESEREKEVCCVERARKREE